MNYLVVHLEDQEAKLTQREMDLAASVQKVTEEIIISLAKSIAEETVKKIFILQEVWP